MQQKQNKMKIYKKKKQNKETNKNEEKLSCVFPSSFIQVVINRRVWR